MRHFCDCVGNARFGESREFLDFFAVTEMKRAAGISDGPSRIIT